MPAYGAFIPRMSMCGETPLYEPNSAFPFDTIFSGGFDRFREYILLLYSKNYKIVKLTFTGAKYILYHIRKFLH